ncbi:MAG: hypothetical protein M0R37_12065 [Bacteroidales bacterium]|jgi:predicted site-specific integrase-resolvase|nr:hypothetical protein [Sphaerochaeta sp.]MCK9629310.1 hypothetical protein [Bacteroidales bacterium]
MPQKTYSLKQVAEMCGISRTAALNRVKKGTMKAHRVAGYLWVVGQDEVDRMREAGEMRNLMRPPKS